MSVTILATSRALAYLEQEMTRIFATRLIAIPEEYPALLIREGTKCRNFPVRSWKLFKRGKCSVVPKIS